MEILKKMFGQKSEHKQKIKDLNPDDKLFGDKLLIIFKEIILKGININVKTSWIKKDDALPLISITKSMDEIQELYETKIVSFDFNVWAKDKKSRDSITNAFFNLLKDIKFGNNFSVEVNQNPLTIEVHLGENSKELNVENEVEISEPQIIDFEEKKGIYRCQLGLTIRVKVKVNKKELQILKDRENKAKFLDTLVLGKFGGVGGEFTESKNKEYILFRPTLQKNIIAFITNNKVLWKADLGSIWSIDMADDGSYVIAVGSLTKKEMPSGYKSGGHVYLITKGGKIKDIKISCDGLSCSIAPDNKNFGITTMGPEWGIYYFNSKGKLLWNKRFTKEIGGIEITDKNIILYDKMHKNTMKKVLELDKGGNILKKYQLHG